MIFLIITGLCQGSSAGLERWSHKPEVGSSSLPLDTNTYSDLLAYFK